MTRNFLVMCRPPRYLYPREAHIITSSFGSLLLFDDLARGLKNDMGEEIKVVCVPFFG